MLRGFKAGRAGSRHRARGRGMHRFRRQHRECRSRHERRAGRKCQSAGECARGQRDRGRHLHGAAEARGHDPDLRLVRWRVPGGPAEGLAGAVHRADGCRVPGVRGVLERDDQGAGRGGQRRVGRRRCRQRLRPRRQRRPARAARLHADQAGRDPRRLRDDVSRRRTSRTASCSPTTPTRPPARSRRAGPTSSTRPRSRASAACGSTPPAASSSSR